MSGGGNLSARLNPPTKFLTGQFGQDSNLDSDEITETLANGYSPDGTQQELSNEYQHDKVYMFFKNMCAIVLWT